MECWEIRGLGKITINRCFRAGKDCSLLSKDYSLSLIYCSPSSKDYSLPSIYCSLSSKDYSPSLIYCSPSLKDYSLSSIYCSPFRRDCSLSSIYCSPSQKDCSLSSIYCSPFRKDCSLFQIVTNNMSVMFKNRGKFAGQNVLFSYARRNSPAIYSQIVNHFGTALKSIFMKINAKIKDV